MTADWGVPDWRDEAGYPSHASGAVWRWEFLRRRPDYREAWKSHQDCIQTAEGITYAAIADPGAMVARFGTAVIYDPRSSFDDWTARQLFRFNSGFVVNYDPAERDSKTLADYRFDLTKPLDPQLRHAREHLISVQQELHGRKSTPRPRQRLWPLYLRVIDARDSGASWKQMSSILGGTIDSIRSTHTQAKGVWFNFPI